MNGTATDEINVRQVFSLPVFSRIRDAMPLNFGDLNPRASDPTARKLIEQDPTGFEPAP